MNYLFALIALLIVIIILWLIIKRVKDEKLKKKLIQQHGNDLGLKLYNKNVSIGMTTEMVRYCLGNPAGSGGTTIRENYIKEVLFFFPQKSQSGKTVYRYTITIVNDKVFEIKEP